MIISVLKVIIYIYIYNHTNPFSDGVSPQSDCFNGKHDDAPLELGATEPHVRNLKGPVAEQASRIFECLLNGAELYESDS